MEEYKSLLEKLTRLVNALENGALSLDELSELEETTRKLHERSIILRYNAFKEMVTEAAPVEEEVAPEPEPEVIPEPIPEPIAEEPEQEEEAPFDFSIFEEQEEEEVKEEEPEKVTPPQPEPVVEPAQEVTPEPEPEPAVEPAPVPVETSEPEPIEEPEEKEEDTTAPTGDAASFLDKLSLPDNSVAGRFAAGKLDSLIGAFGLNERLRFINDLFDGSSELFSDAIKALDGQNDLDSARIKAAGFAQEHGWDPEEDSVIEFMNYINRRYA